LAHREILLHTKLDRNRETGIDVYKYLKLKPGDDNAFDL
jgi:hypothetical protein